MDTETTVTSSAEVAIVGDAMTSRLKFSVMLGGLCDEIPSRPVPNFHFSVNLGDVGKFDHHCDGDQQHSHTIGD